jgi:hypothetical protein
MEVFGEYREFVEADFVELDKTTRKDPTSSRLSVAGR